MNIEITQYTNKEYYKEYYFEWLNHRSKYRKWQQKTGFATLLLSLIVLLADKSLFYLTGGLIVLGLLMIFDYHFIKNKWLKERLESRMNNKSFTMIFQDDEIKSIGPFTNTNSKWEFIDKAIETQKGLILIPENGISIYIQKNSFKRHEDLKLIMNKINN